jgi:amino acid transporter
MPDTDQDDQHNARVTDIIGYTYMAAIAVWIIVIILVTCLDPSFVHPLLGCVFGTPLLLLWYNKDSLTPEDECEIYGGGVLAIGIVVTVSILNHISTSYNGSYGLMAFLVVLALTTLLLSVLDFYLGTRWMRLSRHIRIILKTYSIGFTALVVCMYFLHRKTAGFCVV